MIAKKIKEDIQTSYSVDRWDKSLNLTGLSHFTGIPASVPVSLAPPVEPLPLSGQQYGTPPPKKKSYNNFCLLHLVILLQVFY